jgi:hypothetical protein
MLLDGHHTDVQAKVKTILISVYPERLSLLLTKDLPNTVAMWITAYQCLCFRSRSTSLGVPDHDFYHDLVSSWLFG